MPVLRTRSRIATPSTLRLSGWMGSSRNDERDRDE